MFKGQRQTPSNLKKPNNSKPFKRPNSSQRAGTVVKKKPGESDEELKSEDLDSEYRDMVFDFEESQAMLHKAQNFLDGKDDSKFSDRASVATSNASGQGKNFLENNKDSVAGYRRWKKKSAVE